MTSQVISEMDSNTPQQLQHDPVLLKDVLACLAPVKGETYLDLTAGYGGHAKEVIGRIGKAEYATLVDRDSMSIAALAPLAKSGATLMHTDFAAAATQLAQEGKLFDMILADLGVSSPQFDIPERGFSLRTLGPLDMRMDQRQSLTAMQLVNELNEQELTKVIRRYGEEPQARRIVTAIVEARPIENTTALRDVISRAVTGKNKNPGDACARTFQALRIAVNQELDQLSVLLSLLPDLLRPGGRAAIISFHSLEDRLVKRFFQEDARAGYEARLHILTKRPIAGNTHDVHNPRARSAKLRAAAKINKH